MVVDGVKLVRQRVYPRDGEAEEGIVFICQADIENIKTQAEELGVPLEPCFPGLNLNVL